MKNVASQLTKKGLISDLSCIISGCRYDPPESTTWIPARFDVTVKLDDISLNVDCYKNELLGT